MTVGDVVYRYNADTLHTTRLTLDGQNSAGSKYLSLQSEFADATFRSRTDYKTVFEYLRSSLENTSRCSMTSGRHANGPPAP